MFILYKIFKKEYLLQNYQQVSLILYILALLLSSDAEFIKIKEDISHSTQHSKGPMVLWAVAIVLIVTGSLIILNAWGNEMAESRGYVEPIPLSRTSEGWVPSSHKHYTHSTLLGKIVLREPNLSLLVDNARNGSSLESVIIHPFGRHVPNNGRSSISPTASKSKDSGGNRRHRKSEIEMASLETYNV